MPFLALNCLLVLFAFYALTIIIKLIVLIASSISFEFYKNFCINTILQEIIYGLGSLRARVFVLNFTYFKGIEPTPVLLQKTFLSGME